MTEVIMEAGEWVTCENGHRIAKARATIFTTTEFRPLENFEDWQIPGGTPLPTDPIAPCTICGKRYLGQSNPGSGMVYVEGKGWRPDAATPRLRYDGKEQEAPPLRPAPWWRRLKASWPWRSV